MFDAGSVSDAKLQRSHGAARLRFDLAGGRRRVAERYAAAPLRLLVPAGHGDAPEVVLANTAGGVAGGDSLELSIAAGPSSDGTVSGQAAEKIYRAIDAPARIQTRIGIGTDAALEWLPQETILFDGARLDRTLEIDLCADSRLLMAEMLVFGRRAHGEAFASGRLRDWQRIDRAGRPVWRDALQVEGGDMAFAARPGFAGARALATVIYAGPDAGPLLELARATTVRAGVSAGVTLVRGLLVARLLGAEAGELKRALGDLVARLRAEALGRPARPPRVWLC